MGNTKYNFKFTLFGKKVQMFESGQMGVVIEKEPQVICVYGTDADHQTILCAIPLCPPKYLKGIEYTVEFDSSQLVKVRAGDIKILIDFVAKKCSNNIHVQCYGSEQWGQDVVLAWDAEKDLLF